MSLITNLTKSNESTPLSYSPAKKSACREKLYNFFKIILVAIKSALNLSDYKISHVEIDKITPELAEKLKNFEASFFYPFSEQERFRIKHGSDGDYFAFFKQLGKVHYYIATYKKNETVTKVVNGEKVIIERKAGEIAAVGCGVLRTLKTYQGELQKAWYICDLKVGEKYQGEHCPLMLIKNALWRFFQAPRGFGICMNPPYGEPKAAKIWRKYGTLSGSDNQILNLYTLTAAQVNEHRKNIDVSLREHRYMQENEHLAFKSTSGCKDYQIYNENGKETRPWQLLHIQPSVENLNAPQPGYTHMLSAVDGTALDTSFKKILGLPSSTAQIVSYGMRGIDFNYLTSNQI